MLIPPPPGRRPTAVSQSSPEHHVTEFGPNEWLVDELYQQYLEDKNSVDPAWWEFFADYQPADAPSGQTTSRRGDATAANGRAATDGLAGGTGAANPVATSVPQPQRTAPERPAAAP